MSGDTRAQELVDSNQGLLVRGLVLVGLMLVFCLPLLVFCSFALGIAIAESIISAIEGNYSPRQKQLLSRLTEIGSLEIEYDHESELPPEFQHELIRLCREAEMSGIPREVIEATIHRGRALARSFREPSLISPIGI